MPHFRGKPTSGQAVKGVGASFPVLVRHRSCSAATASFCIAAKGLQQKASNKGSLD